MAQNSRIAVSMAQNTMARSSTSIDSTTSNDRTTRERSQEKLENDDVIVSSGDVLRTDSARINQEMSNSLDSSTEEHRFWFPSVTTWYSELNKAHAVTVGLLCYCNLINYMDRSTVAGMISFIKDDNDFNVKSDKKLGLLQVK